MDRNRSDKAQANVANFRRGGLTRRQFLRRTAVVGVSLSSGASLLAACAGDEGGEGTSGRALTDTLRIRLIQDIQNLDPAVLPATTDAAVLLCIAEGLVTYDPETGDLVNQLAERLESSDDGLRHEFKLKEGIPFHGDYGEVTAEDVKFSFERIAGLTDPPLDSVYAGDWEPLEAVEVSGTYTGTIVLNKPFAPLMRTTLPGNAGLVVSKQAVEELGDDFALRPIGTGPYELTSYERGQRVVLSRFADYGGASLEWTNEPQWEQIIFRPIEDDSSADIALETDEVDFGLISHTSVDRFTDNPDFEVLKQTTFDYGWVGFNVQDEVLSDVNVRRALRYAIDVPSIITAAFDGRVTRADALIAPGMPLGHWEDAPVYERDVERAQEMLAQAGVENTTLSMTIAEEPGSSVVAEVVQANLAEVGITVNIQLQDVAAIRESLDELQLFYFSFSNSADPSWATVWFTTDQIGEWNFMSWSNEEFDRLHEEALAELDEDRRHEMYVRMQQLMDEDAVAKWVQYRTLYYAFNPPLQPALVTPKYGKYLAWDFDRE